MGKCLECDKLNLKLKVAVDGLKNILKHHELIAKPLTPYSTVSCIAGQALAKIEGKERGENE